MLYNPRYLLLTTLVVIYASSVLASRRHPRHYSKHRPSFVGDNKDYRAEAMTILSQYDASYWPSNTGDCVTPELHLRPDASVYYIHDGQFYDKHCLKTLVYLVEPEERAACRTQSDCHRARGYDNECLMRLSFDQGFDFNFEEIGWQELEWKKFVCHGKTLGQCGQDHSPWWRSRFPSSRDDCRIHKRAGQRQDASNDKWVPWSIGPRETLYDNDCLSRFANRLGMENPGNCTQANHVIHKAREAPSVELPKTLLYATDPSGIQPYVVFPTRATQFATPVATYGRERRRGDIPPSPVRTLARTTNVPASSLPLVGRAQGSVDDVDEWSCMWDVYVTLPDPAPGMFDASFGSATIDKMLLVTQEMVEVQEGSECSDAT